MTIQQILLQRPRGFRAGASAVLAAATLLLLTLVFGMDGATAPGDSSVSLLAAGRLAAGLAWIAAVAYMMDLIIGKPERVRVSCGDGTVQIADVCGASDIPDGHTKEVRVRFYHYTGEPAWLTGNGYQRVPISRIGGRLATP